ncbi:hypothetical protein [Flavobacterium phragmitis]|uniref:Glycosyltransferase family 1 protein n=1 Tax=Flavobacterium phragmitis TaxID=739143 RepID=A0A1I1UPA0_9FLAO|nr:hypothetical protein [Flavobacterium phragmitis]SFD72405.1 hypothetical protein SAMN05216297_111106 [Flavobacterium phragmitis]
MILELPSWSSHHNMLIYSVLFYCEENNLDFNIVFSNKIMNAGAVLHVSEGRIFFDYSDSILFIDDPKKYDFYFKRSLRQADYIENVYPLNFQVNFSYKSLSLLLKINFKSLIDNRNRTEVIRGIDYFNIGTNLSHRAMDIRYFPEKVNDNNGRIIFHTRLWDPKNNSDFKEKERREIQNEFRIEACRIIKNNFKNSSVGIFPDSLSQKIAPDLLLDLKKTSKKEYFSSLLKADIGIADDGLKDTPGWKIGEYLLFGKSIVSTPLNVTIEEFDEHVHYEKLSTRNAYNELPEKIENLLSEKKYLEMGQNNFIWSNLKLHPKNYIKRILFITKL